MLDRFSDQYTLEKADPEKFSFWVNNIWQKIVLPREKWANRMRSQIPALSKGEQWGGFAFS